MAAWPSICLPREFRLLEYLMKHAGQVVTRAMLLENVWDIHFDPNTSVVETHISRLRSKIDRCNSVPLIHTVRGSGYTLRAPQYRVFRTSSFRLALMYAGFTGVSFLVLFGVIFWSTTRFMRHQIDDSISNEIDEIISESRERPPEEIATLVQGLSRHSSGFYYLLQDANRRGARRKPAGPRSQRGNSRVGSASDIRRIRRSRQCAAEGSRSRVTTYSSDGVRISSMKWKRWW